jgi:rhomboid family GlyGly-CTERM serine protease
VRLHRLGAPGVAWVAVAAVLLLGSLLAWPAPHEAWLWRRDTPAQVWRWWSAALVHRNALHLGANLAGLALVGVLGVAVRLPWQAAAAWALAWPLTHLGLWLAETPNRYGGLSGVLHAGIAIAAVFMTCTANRRQRLLGIAIAFGLVAKLATESPWVAAVHPSSYWGFPVVVGAHAAGALAGLLISLAALVARRFPR